MKTMKTMKTIPFDLELAKEIHEGKRGRIVTREGDPVKILAFDINTNEGNIVFLTKNYDGFGMTLKVAYNDGIIYRFCSSEYDLFLEVPKEVPAEESVLKPFDRVLVRDYDDSVWACNFFSHYTQDDSAKYGCIDTCYKYCIPYKGNEELLGTTKVKKHI